MIDDVFVFNTDRIHALAVGSEPAHDIAATAERVRALAEAAACDRNAWRERAEAAERRLDEIDRDVKLVRGNLVHRQTIELPLAAWHAAQRTIEALQARVDDARGWWLQPAIHVLMGFAGGALGVWLARWAMM